MICMLCAPFVLPPRFGVYTEVVRLRMRLLPPEALALVLLVLLVLLVVRVLSRTDTSVDGRCCVV